MTTTATLIHNNAYDALIIEDANGKRVHYIDSAATFLDALATGAAQDLDNWSGDLLTDDANATEMGDVIAINDGVRLNVVAADMLARRRDFHAA